MVYEQWAKEGNFGIVLVYIDIHKTSDYCIPATGATFWARFHHMPWFALPFKNPKSLTLQRIVEFPDVFTIVSW